MYIDFVGSVTYIVLNAWPDHYTFLCLMYVWVLPTMHKEIAVYNLATQYDV